MRILADIQERENNSFGLIRLIAAVLVVVSHSYLLTGGTLISEPLANSTSFPLGAHAVHVFFALSGFLIAARWQARPDLAHFIAGRVLRIMPALVFVALATLVIAALVISSPANPLYLVSPEALFFFARTVFLLDGGGSLASVVPQNEVSGAILATVWTLRFEAFCYFSIPLILGATTRTLRSGLLASIAVLLASGGWLVFNNPHFLDAGLIDNLARFFFSFYLGVLAWFLRERIALSVFGVIALGLATWFCLETQISQVMEIAFVAYATLWVGSIRFGKLSRLTNTEDVSYGVYLMGYPIQQLVLALLPSTNAILNASITLVIALPLAFISWRIIEKPFLSYRDALKAILKLEMTLPNEVKVTRVVR